MSENLAKVKGNSDEWTMPEPVFRTSEGVSPRETAGAPDAASALPDDMPTEMMGFVEDQASTEAAKQAVRVKEKNQRRHHKKKRTQSKLMRALALLIGLLIGTAILAVIYFLFR